VASLGGGEAGEVCLEPPACRGGPGVVLEVIAEAAVMLGRGVERCRIAAPSMLLASMRAVADVGWFLR
jgi:hypothetical protein